MTFLDLDGSTLHLDPNFEEINNLQTESSQLGCSPCHSQINQGYQGGGQVTPSNWDCSTCF